MIATLLIILFVLLFLGAPLMLGLLLSSFAAIQLYMPDIDPLWLTQQITGGVESFTLLAVPMLYLEQILWLLAKLLIDC